jgi:hypothetical protein
MIVRSGGKRLIIFSRTAFCMEVSVTAGNSTLAAERAFFSLHEAKTARQTVTNKIKMLFIKLQLIFGIATYIRTVN